MNTKFKEESLIIIGTWAKTLEQNKLLIDCITNLDLLGMDICLVSHYPISTTIQKLVSYYVYDKYNGSSLLHRDEEAPGWYWNYFPIQAFFSDTGVGYSHESAVLYSMRNGFSLAKSVGKKYAFYMESDAIIHPKDLHSLYDIYEETLNNNKKAWFTRHDLVNIRDNDITAIETLFFFSDVELVMDNFDFNKIDWGGGLETYLFRCVENSMDKLFIEDTDKELTDLVDNSGYLLSYPEISTDKGTGHSYMDVYHKLFSNIKYSAKNVLEIGIFEGGSMILWHDYFENAIIHGVDIIVENIPEFLNEYDRIKTYLGGAYNYEEFIEPTFKDMKFDLIIDDGSHELHTQKRFVKHYFPLLSENGILIIEDIQDVDFCKEIINEFPEEVRDKVQIIDRRGVKNRYDDILIVYDNTINIVQNYPRFNTLLHRFPNSVMDQHHRRLSYHAKDINPKIKNFHLIGRLLLSTERKYGLKPLLILINFWDKTSWKTSIIRRFSNDNLPFTDTMFKDKDNIFKILYFENDNLLTTDEVNLKEENSSYFKQFPEIVDLKDYKVRVELYNEYAKSWELFYERKYDLNRVDELQEEGHYNFPVHHETDVEEDLKIREIK